MNSDCKRPCKSLDDLIGLDAIKNEVRELTRFLRVQQQREQAGPAAHPGEPAHRVCRQPRHRQDVGGPRAGRGIRRLGIVTKGHLIEADRSALVAGLCRPNGRTHQQDHRQALDGVLFIDEAYSLVSEKGDDPFGNEAVQILLKRMEDNRDRLVVVLAGYPEEMQRLLATNPGLASRFQRTFDFPDYSVVELCRIFQTLCDKERLRAAPRNAGPIDFGI